VKKIILNFGAGFRGLREGFEALGYEVLENQWAPDEPALRGAALCVADFVDCARKVRRTLGLRKRLSRAKDESRDRPADQGGARVIDAAGHGGAGQTSDGKGQGAGEPQQPGASEGVPQSGLGG